MPKRENIEFVIVHITAIPWGTVDSIRRFHVNERGWQDIGYHYLITNCYPTYDSISQHLPQMEYDGEVWFGRDLDRDGDIDEEIGAHALGFNGRSLGIALIGQNGIFSSPQIVALSRKVKELQDKYDISTEKVIGHNETGNTSKSCPELEMNWFRGTLD